MAATSRFETRMTPESHALLKRAAELQGRTMSDFVLAAALEAAEKAIANAEVVALTVADQAAFANALISPPPATPALKRAADRRRQLLSE